MVSRFFIGDKAKCKYGVGIVVQVDTWRKRIGAMEYDFEAQEFSEQCKQEVGIDYQDIWELVFLKLDNSSRVVHVQSKNVELLEGRDDGNKKTFAQEIKVKNKKNNR